MCLGACDLPPVGVAFKGTISYSIENIPFETLQDCVNSENIVELTDKVVLVWAENLSRFNIEYFEAVSVLTGTRACYVPDPDPSCGNNNMDLYGGCGWGDGFWVSGHYRDGEPYDSITLCRLVAHELGHVVAARFGLPDNGEYHNTPIWNSLGVVSKQACE